ncbi:cytochrome P450 [Streptomyces albofaciens JCM 4342]|uniref:cytochrome P450 family protein n=1 Tax=Streptomyces albofaciens TaxID=66866 RepID=UPI001238AF57|nr:cytochrome P450 [Streptomyces albofaciens]KAA6212799.1 cytochrome P450 [Streptomyces albofaciens JCM 4342]
MQNTAETGPDDLIDVTQLLDDPHAGYAVLREAGPVHRIAGPDGQPAWLVTRYEDVRRCLSDPRLSLDKRNARGGYRGFALPPALDANLLNMDPPDHTRVRRLVARAFSPARVEKLREPVRRIADGLLDAVADAGRADLIASYAGPLPIIVICDLLGVPERDRPDFRAWTDALITPDPARPERAKEAVGAMMRYYTGLIAAKRAAPGDDLLSDLILVRDGAAAEGGPGDRLGEDELTSLAFLLLFAGYENTVHLIGNSVLALLDHPEHLIALRTNPAELSGAVEEFARYDGPASLAIRRFPLEDVEIGGIRVPAGESVLLSLASANRDPHRFPDPGTFDPGRDAAGQLMFGHGIHHCLGAALARMQTETALTALISRFPGLRLDVPRAELRHRRTLRARGLISLPVAW